MQHLVAIGHVGALDQLFEPLPVDADGVYGKQRIGQRCILAEITGDIGSTLACQHGIAFGQAVGRSRTPDAYAGNYGLGVGAEPQQRLRQALHFGAVVAERKIYDGVSAFELDGHVQRVATHILCGDDVQRK